MIEGRKKMIHLNVDDLLETPSPQQSRFLRLWERFRLLVLTRAAFLFAALMLAAARQIPRVQCDR